MSIARFSDGLCTEMELILNRYWWGTTDVKRKVHWLSWKRLSVPKKDGGLGFRSFKEFNSALLAKQGWRLLTRPDSLAARVLKAKYFPSCSFLEAEIKPHSRPSFTWQSIMLAQSLVRKGCRCVVGDGTSIRVWEDDRLPGINSHIVSSKPP